MGHRNSISLTRNDLKKQKHRSDVILFIIISKHPLQVVEELCWIFFFYPKQNDCREAGAAQRVTFFHRSPACPISVPPLPPAHLCC